MTFLSHVDQRPLDFISIDVLCEILSIKSRDLAAIILNSSVFHADLQNAVIDKFGNLTQAEQSDPLLLRFMQFSKDDFWRVSKCCTLLHNRLLVLRCTDPRLLHEVIQWSEVLDMLNVLKIHSAPMLAELPKLEHLSIDLLNEQASVFLQLILGLMPKSLLIRYAVLIGDMSAQGRSLNPENGDLEALKKLILLSEDVSKQVAFVDSKSPSVSYIGGENMTPINASVRPEVDGLSALRSSETQSIEGPENANP